MPERFPRRSLFRDARVRLIWMSGVLAATSACTPMHSTLRPPYPFHGSCLTAPQMKSIALAQCAAGNPGRPLPPHPFTTDGCTLWPNGAWKECCIDHDTKYWCGGSKAQRLRADRELRSCVRRHSNSVNATLMFAAVRLSGVRWLPFPWRWGYGFDWGAAMAVRNGAVTMDRRSRFCSKGCAHQPCVGGFRAKE